MIRELQLFETRHCFYQNELDLTTLVSTLSLFMRFNLAGSVWSVSSRLEPNAYTCNAAKQRALLLFFSGWRGGMSALGAYVCKLSQTLFSCLGSDPITESTDAAGREELRDGTL